MDGIAITDLSANQDFSDRYSLGISLSSSTLSSAELNSIVQKINKVVIGSFVIDLKALKALGKTFITTSASAASLSITHNDSSAIYSVARDFHVYLKPRKYTQLVVVIQ